jgi:mono/diheme cytochrome c family protein
MTSIKRQLKPTTHRKRLQSLLILIGLCGFQTAMADDKVNQISIPALPQYQQECAACHIAYPAGMLPKVSWRRLMNNLPNHFGTDASMDAASVQQISQWLERYGEVSAQTWKLAAVKSPSNCMACHQQANLGDFNEHRVRIPR